MHRSPVENSDGVTWLDFERSVSARQEAKTAKDIMGIIMGCYIFFCKIHLAFGVCELPSNVLENPRASYRLACHYDRSDASTPHPKQCIFQDFEFGGIGEGSTSIR